VERAQALDQFGSRVKATTRSSAQGHPRRCARWCAAPSAPARRLSVQERVAQPLGLGPGQLAFEAEPLHPDQQVAGDEDQASQAALMAKLAEGRLASPVSLASQIRRSQRPRPR
jgi:hypothetical protein